MATFKQSEVGALFRVEATGKLEMVVLTRTKKEKFTDFIDREAKRQGLKAVVNGSFTDLSTFDQIRVQVFNDPLDPSDSKPVGLVIQGGKQTAGSSSTGKFYFSQNVCGLDRFSTGQGDPPISSCAAVGGLAPIVADGLPYGASNMYSSSVPAFVLDSHVPAALLLGDDGSKHRLR